MNRVLYKVKQCFAVAGLAVGAVAAVVMACAVAVLPWIVLALVVFGIASCMGVF